MRFGRIVLLVALFCCLAGTAPSFAKERKGQVTIEVDLKSPAEAKDVKLWIPYPVSDGNQDITDVAIKGNYSQAGVYREPKSGNSVLYAEWKGPTRERKLVYVFQVTRREQVTAEFTGKELAFSPGEFKPYLEGSPSLPLTPKIKGRALAVTQGETTVLAKARALYDWIVENMYRDPNVKGCGLGEVERLLETGGGKCADIHSVFVALARSAGIPAREAFGIRMPKGREGDMTKSQHCWAEFYLPGKGWVVVDPADVRKYILEQQCDLAKAKPVREYYFGTVDESRIAFGTGRDIVLNPPQSGGPLNYFMYPYAEADGKPINEDLYGFNIGYKISFKEL